MQAWFAPLVETLSHLLQDFDAFLADVETFEASIDIERPLHALYSLHQQMYVVIVYTFEFRQHACDIHWDSEAFVTILLGPLN